MPSCRSLVAFSLIISLWWARDVAAQAKLWNGWRGANRDGVATIFVAPEKWPAKLERVWSLKVGVGHSSPILGGKRILQFSREGEQEVLRAIDLQGKAIWEQRYDAPYKMHSAATGHGKGPKATPTADDQFVYTLGIDGIFQCRQASDGKLIWQASRTSLPGGSPLYGASSSPLKIKRGTSVFVHLGQHDSGAFCAFIAPEKKHQLFWKWTGDGPSYASPVMMEFGNLPQIVTQSQKSCLGFSLDGKLLWRIPFTTGYDQNAVTPVQFNDLVIISGFQKGVTALRVAKPGEQWTAEEAWHSDDASMYMSSPVIVGERLYGYSEKNKGQLFCLEAATGKTVWLGPPRSGENAAIVVAGEVLAALTTDAKLAFYRPADKYEPLATYDVAETPTWAHPILAGRGIVVKDESHLTLWRLP